MIFVQRLESPVLRYVCLIYYNHKQEAWMEPWAGLPPGTAEQTLIGHGHEQTVCVRPNHVSQAVTDLKGSGVKVASVIGFHEGTQDLYEKLSYASRSLPPSNPYLLHISSSNNTSPPLYTPIN